ncbi:DUF6172 family protein [Sulfurospirillum arcachonense]|uniref:DUF6172 family protein n=1 Tax=Sulfurospirillum arcachonense TaxID=57666 RepID=UPI00046A56AA|nr:DUF6172 family protein [Sulfurospirillum arcachonense]
MKKVFNLKEGNKNPDRILDAIKYEIRKYIKREKRKPLPEGVDFWDLQCKFGKNSEEAKTIEFVDITKNINEASKENLESFYMEIIATQGYKPKEKVE